MSEDAAQKFVRAEARALEFRKQKKAALAKLAEEGVLKQYAEQKEAMLEWVLENDVVLNVDGMNIRAKQRREISNNTQIADVVAAVKDQAPGADREDYDKVLKTLTNRNKAAVRECRREERERKMREVEAATNLERMLLMGAKPLPGIEGVGKKRKPVPVPVSGGERSDSDGATLSRASLMQLKKKKAKTEKRRGKSKA